MTTSKYIEISASRIPGNVRFDVPRRNQGQHVEVAFGGFGRYEHDDGDQYKRIVDRSTGRTTYYRLSTDAAS